MSKELIERLRYESPGPNHIATEAADRIEQLETERDQLRDALEQLLDDMGDTGHCVCEATKQYAKEALAATEQNP